MKTKIIVVIHFFLSILYFQRAHTQETGTGFSCGSPIQDLRNGKIYKTVQIGSQCWMSDNLDVGERISMLKDQRDNGVIEKYCYDNQDENCKVYGGLYQWGEAMQFDSVSGARGICPEGWHLPSDEEWCTLATFLDPSVDCGLFGASGDSIGGKLRATGTIEKKSGMWYFPNRDAANSSGFNAIPGGTRSIYSKFFYLGYHGYFWSSSEKDRMNAWFWYLKYSNTGIYRENYFKNSGYSVRCVLD